MDHENAIRSHAPERYLLGELTAGEREEFEDHFADCPSCMRDLAAGDAFAANANAVFGDEALTGRVGARAAEGRKSPWWTGWLGWRPTLALSGAVNLALAAAVGVALLRPTAPMVGAVEEFTAHGAARAGAGESFLVHKGAAFANFKFDVTRRYERISYRLDGVESAADLSAPADGDSMRVAVAVAGLKPGAHRVEVRGWDGASATTIVEFGIQIEEAGK